MIISLIEISLLIVILVLVILIYIKNKDTHDHDLETSTPTTEGFENCFGMQYYGEPFYNNYNNKICSKNTTKPLYKEGGCAEYDPEKISAEYAQGKFTSAV